MDHDVKNIASLIGTKATHGSPGHPMAEIISSITFLKDHVVEVEFESGFFTQMNAEEFRDLMRYNEVEYNELTHGGMSMMTLPA